MAVNLATKYEKQFAAAFKPTSFFEGKVNDKFDFSGAKSIRIYSPVTTPLTDYTRSGANRYGTPAEMNSVVQELTLTQDKAFTQTIDRGNFDDTMMSISAASWMSEEIKGIVIPTLEKYAADKWIREAGRVEGISAKPTKTTVVEAFLNGMQAMTDKYVPNEERYLYITAEMLKAVMLADEFVKADKLAEKAMSKGVIGELAGAKVVVLPTSYLPADAYGFLARKDSILLPKKISTFKTHTNPPGIDGWLVEGRVYYDAFVLGAKADGVWALVLGSKKQAAPEISFAEGSLTITSTGAERIIYTTNGADPRYDDKAKAYTGAVSTTEWEAGKYTVRAVAYGGTNTPFTSDVAEKEITVA